MSAHSQHLPAAGTLTMATKRPPVKLPPEEVKRRKELEKIGRRKTAGRSRKIR